MVAVGQRFWVSAQVSSQPAKRSQVASGEAGGTFGWKRRFRARFAANERFGEERKGQQAATLEDGTQRD
jgi:hypothetical protein